MSGQKDCDLTQFNIFRLKSVIVCFDFFFNFDSFGKHLNESYVEPSLE